MILIKGLRKVFAFHIGSQPIGNYWTIGGKKYFPDSPRKTPGRRDPACAEALRDIFETRLDNAGPLTAIMLEMLLFCHRQEWSLLYFQEDGILQYAEAVPSAHHKHDVAGLEFTRGHQLAVVVVNIRQAMALLKNQYFGCADQVSFQGQVQMALYLASSRINDKTDLLFKLRRRNKSSLARQRVGPEYVCQGLVVPIDYFAQLL